MFPGRRTTRLGDNRRDMSEQNLNPSGETQQADGQNTPPQTDESLETLRARLGGLNKAYNAKQTEWSTKFDKQQNVIADLTTQKKDAEVQIGQLTKQLELLSNEKGSFEKQATDFGSKAATLETQVSRMKLFMLPQDQGGFSDLAHLEAKGLLKDNLSGEDLTSYLNEYRSTLAATTKAAVQETVKGGVPPSAPTKKDGEVDATVLEGQMKEAMNKGDWAAFEALNTQWVKLKTAK